MNSKETFVPTKLKTKASEELNKEIEEELKQDDPDQEKAQAVLRGETNETRSKD